MTLQVTTITPGIGAEISGIDLARPLTAAQAETLRELFLRHMVLVFRDQALDRDQHKTFARQFGEIHIHPSKRNGMNQQDAEVFIIDTKADATITNGEAWHSDVSCDAIPPSASLLYVSRVPENGGGDTLFANMYAAYAELSPDLKQLLGNKTAMHDGEVDLRNYGIRLRLGQTYPANSHPVVIAHPQTQRPLLFVNRSFTSHIEGLPRWESNMLLEGLYQQIANNPRIQCRVKWTPGTLTMWDNRCVQHQAVRDYAGFARYGERVSIVDGCAPVPAALP
jgi:taurine dioxygenase